MITQRYRLTLRSLTTFSLILSRDGFAAPAALVLVPWHRVESNNFDPISQSVTGRSYRSRHFDIRAHLQVSDILLRFLPTDHALIRALAAGCIKLETNNIEEDVVVVVVVRIKRYSDNVTLL